MTDLQQDDIGTILRFTVTENGIPVDMSAATTKKLLLEKKDKTTVEHDLVYTTDGTDGKVEYVTVLGDLDQKGKLKAQVYLETTDGKWHTSTYEWDVGANIATPAA